MGQTELLKEIDRLDLSEKILLVEDIWDSIARRNSELPMPEWHKQELDRRSLEFQSGKTILHDWRDVHAALRHSAR